MKKRTLLISSILMGLGLIIFAAGNANALIQETVFLPVTFRNYCPGFFDDFSHPSSGWPVFEDADRIYDYVDGEYRIVAKNTDWWVGANPDYQAENFYVSVQLRNLNTISGRYGILFNIAEDWSHFYSYEIDQLGSYGIWRYSDSDGWTLLTGGNSPQYINQSSRTNHLVVKRNGSDIELYANGNYLTSVNDGTHTGKSYLGLIVNPYSTPNLDIRFDNFSISPCISGNPPTPPPTPTTEPSDCDPSYPTVCIPPPPPDLDCDDTIYANFKVLPPDPHNFDSDGDGIGCER